MLADRIADTVEDQLRQQHQGQPTLYRRELGICCGAGRIDVAAVNGSITACEIKSSSDSFARLPLQVDMYGQVADYAVLAVERVNPERVAAKVPDWWGVWHVVEYDEERLRLDVLRAPRRNPEVQPFALAQLLWRDEVFDALRARDLHRGLASATRWKLWQRLVDELTVEELGTEVRERLRARRGW